MGERDGVFLGGGGDSVVGEGGRGVVEAEAGGGRDGGVGQCGVLYVEVWGLMLVVRMSDWGGFFGGVLEGGGFGRLYDVVGWLAWHGSLDMCGSSFLFCLDR